MKSGLWIFVLCLFILLFGFVSAQETICILQNGTKVPCDEIGEDPYKITNDSCSTEKNLVAKGFEVVKDKDASGVKILLDFDEGGLCIEDDYNTEFDYSLNGGKTFHKSSLIRRQALRLNGARLSFLKMLYYKVTFRDLTIRANMDFFYMSQEYITSVSTLPDQTCSFDIDCAYGGRICIQGQCVSLLQMNNSIKETNENDNCIQQEFKIKLFARELVPVAPAVTCINYTDPVD